MTDLELKNTFKEIILWYQQHIPKLQIVSRHFDFEPQMRYIIVGLRRAGKSYLLYQHIQRLINAGTPAEKILFVNFEDERIADIPKEKLHLLLTAYSEMFAHEPIIFLDEIQNITGWEHFARRLADEGRQVFITGSNSHMLSREMASVLGGRFLPIELWPFSFDEYLRYHSVVRDANYKFSPQKTEIARLLTDYYNYGGFAESFALTDKRIWLSSLFNKVLFSDIMLRKEIRNKKAISGLVKKLADALMQPVGIKRIHDLLRADGTKITRATVTTYIAYLEEAFISLHLDNFTNSLSERENIKKYYFRDNGLLNIFLLGNKAKLLENIVAVSLFKRYGESLFYYRKNIEVDFYLPESDWAIQASYEIDNADTLDHETEALLALHRFRPLRRATIVTYETEDRFEVDGLTIEVVPLAHWLLDLE